LEKVAQALPADRQTRDEVSQDDKTEHDVEQQASRLNDEATRGGMAWSAGRCGNLMH
jgi:polysaccharide deacetylase 2 family uncharacterized protein YibQ